MGGILGIAAAVVEKEANIVCSKHLDQPFVLPSMLLKRAELVAAGSEGCPRGVLERSDRGLGLGTCVDEVFGQRAENTISPGINLADLPRMTAGGLQHAAGRSVDYRGDTARLGIEGISTGHRNLLRIGKHRSKDCGKFSPSNESVASFGYAVPNRPQARIRVRY